MSRLVVPLSRRKGDLLFILFFVVNILFITYMVDIEQLIIPDPYHFTYPAWPPAPVVDAVHWWGSNFDPVLMARPAWWKATIWIDVLFFGPFYVLAIYAFARGRNWIRLPALLYSATMMANVIIILSEEIYGTHASPHLPIVLLANLPWLLYPIFITYRMARNPEPFTQPEQLVLLRSPVRSIDRFDSASEKA